MQTVLWILRVLVAVIFIQTLYFKFSGAPESIYIFEKLGAEPYGRFASGVAELVASILILWPRYTRWGALLGLGIISGALISHLTKLGIEVQGDGGLLFGLAVIVFFGCLGIIFIERKLKSVAID